MKRLPLCFWATALCFLLCHRAHAQPGRWTYLEPNAFYFGSENYNIEDITFANSQVGYACNGNYQLMKTTDGGITWTMMPALSCQAELLHFMNASTGWATDFNIIAQTTNGGQTWINQLNLTQMGYAHNSLYGFTFTDSLNGYVFGSNLLLKTADGGVTWLSIAPASADTNWSAVSFLNKDTGWAFYDTVVARTLNGGTSWSISYISNIKYTDIILSARFYDANTGIAFMANGTEFKTRDGGITWDSVMAVPYSPSSFKFGQGGFIYGESNYEYLVSSVDTGRTWSQDSVSFSVLGNYYLSRDTGYLGFTQIYKTTNGGQTWQSDSQQVTWNDFPILDIDWISPQSILAIDISDYDYQQSNDAGGSWNLVTPNIPLLQVQSVSPTCYFAFSDYNGPTLFRYDNGVQDLSLSYCTLLYAQSKDSFIVCSDSLGSIYSTIDGGNTWHELIDLPSVTAPYNSFNGAPFAEWKKYLESGTDYISNFSNFVNWDTGFVAFTDSIGQSIEFLTLNAGNNWISFAPDTVRGPIIATKVSPAGELFSLRQKGAYTFGLWKVDSNLQWSYVNQFNLSPAIVPITYSTLDFGWSDDSTMWSSIVVNNNLGSTSYIAYSRDGGVTFTPFPLTTFPLSAIKRCSNGKLMAGTDWGESTGV